MAQACASRTFAELSDQRFLEMVIQGRKGAQMLAFGPRLVPDEVRQIHAFSQVN